jgi:hypothetical protein
MWIVKFGKGGIRACKRLFQDLNALMVISFIVFFFRKFIACGDF